MSPHEVFTAVSAEFSPEVAARVLVVYAIQLSLKPKEEDLLMPGRFQQRIEKRARKVLWRETAEEFAQAFQIAMALYDFDVRKSMAGIGGCTPATLKQLVEAEAAKRVAVEPVSQGALG